MVSIAEIYPDAEVLVAVEPEELALALIRVARSNIQNGNFHPGNIAKFPSGINAAQAFPTYARREGEADIAIAEGWNWLRVQGFMVPAPGMNGNNGWMVLNLDPLLIRRARQRTAS